MPRASPRLQGPPQPIADLLSSDAEEEIELLSISSDQELEPPPPPSKPLVPPEPVPEPSHAPPAALSGSDLDDAFGSIGALPPATVPVGAQVRLQNLGYYAGHSEEYRHRVIAIDTFYYGESKIASHGFLFAVVPLLGP